MGGSCKEELHSGVDTLFSKKAKLKIKILKQNLDMIFLKNANVAFRENVNKDEGTSVCVKFNIKKISLDGIKNP